MHFVTCPIQGCEMEAAVLHRVGFLAYSCLNRERISNPQRHPYTQTWVKYPSRGAWRKEGKERCLILVLQETHNKLRSKCVVYTVLLVCCNFSLYFSASSFANRKLTTRSLRISFIFGLWLNFICNIWEQKQKQTSLLVKCAWNQKISLLVKSVQ